jgi:hypothetical protein
MTWAYKVCRFLAHVEYVGHVEHVEHVEQHVFPEYAISRDASFTVRVQPNQLRPTLDLNSTFKLDGLCTTYRHT